MEGHMLAWLKHKPHGRKVGGRFGTRGDSQQKTAESAGWINGLTWYKTAPKETLSAICSAAQSTCFPDNCHLFYPHILNWQNANRKSKTPSGEKNLRRDTTVGSRILVTSSSEWLLQVGRMADSQSQECKTFWAARFSKQFPSSLCCR